MLLEHKKKYLPRYFFLITKLKTIDIYCLHSRFYARFTRPDLKARVET